MGLLNFLSASSMMMTAVADSLSAPKGVWEWLLLKAFELIGDYGLSIILFIIALKLVLLPIDLFQRIKMRKNQKISERIRPQLEDIQKRYGNDKNLLSQKQMELNKKEGFSYFSSCLPMIITLVIFITLLQGMNNISQYMIFKQYAEWYDVYTTSFEEEKANLGDEYLALVSTRDEYLGKERESENRINELISSFKDESFSVADMDEIKKKDPQNVSEVTGPVETILSGGGLSDSTIANLEEYIQKVNEYISSRAERVKYDNQVTEKEKKAVETAQRKVWEYNDENANSFLWIKSIWRPDTTWSSPVFSSRDEFTNATSLYTGAKASGCGGCGSCRSCKSASGLENETIETMLANYTTVTQYIRDEESGKKNGYFILVVLVVVLSFLSQWISQRIQKQSGQFEANGATNVGTMKAMMFTMPILLGIFAISYTAAFALYMVTNSAMTILINVITTLIMNSKDKSTHEKTVTTVNKYGRPDPRDLKK